MYWIERKKTKKVTNAALYYCCCCYPQLPLLLMWVINIAMAVMVMTSEVVDDCVSDRHHAWGSKHSVIETVAWRHSKEE